MLFDEIIFGPLKSRRFGKSLGVNLLPLDNKVCNFNCIYCECGWTDLSSKKVSYTLFESVVEAMEKKFQELSLKKDFPDAITFAGNGEPTMHPKFPEVIDVTIKLRDKYMPDVKIVVLSNGVLMNKREIADALLKIDLCVMKLDAGTDELFRVIDQPLNNKELSWYVNNLKKLGDRLMIQSIFLKGRYKGKQIDNTEEENLNCWINYLKELKPKQVMIYTLDRETPAEGLSKIDKSVLDVICNRVKQAGISAEVYS